MPVETTYDIQGTVHLWNPISGGFEPAPGCEMWINDNGDNRTGFCSDQGIYGPATGFDPYRDLWIDAMTIGSGMPLAHRWLPAGFAPTEPQCAPLTINFYGALEGMDPDQDEPNDTPATATALQLPVHGGYLGGPGDVDYLAVNLSALETLKVVIYGGDELGAPGGGSGSFTLFDAGENPVAGPISFNGGDGSLEQRTLSGMAAEDGTWYIRVDGGDGPYVVETTIDPSPIP